MTKLAVTRLNKSFGDLEVLRGINLAVERGEFISVVGPSGCGKTTFLRIIAGLEQATSGEVLLDGHVVRKPGNDRGFVFQNDSLLPWRTVLDNAIIGRELAGPVGPSRPQAHHGAVEARRARGFRALSSAAAFRRHASARQPRARARDRSRRFC